MSDCLSDELGVIERACFHARRSRDVFRAVDAALQRLVGHRLLTVLVYDEACTVATRLYSSDPATYPEGATDPVASPAWADQVLHWGLPFVGHCEEELACVFAHHERLAFLGLGSVVNMPLRWQGRVLGSLNMLDAPERYAHIDIDVVRIIAHTAVPALLAG
jgi:hypothetical protein